jgi:hypothetical protein
MGNIELSLEWNDVGEALATWYAWENILYKWQKLCIKKISHPISDHLFNFHISFRVVFTFCTFISARVIRLVLNRVRVIERLFFISFGETSQSCMNSSLSIHPCKASMTMRS